MSQETKQPVTQPEPAKPHYVLVVQNAKHAPKLVVSTQEKQNG